MVEFVCCCREHSDFILRRINRVHDVGNSDSTPSTLLHHTWLVLVRAPLRFLMRMRQLSSNEHKERGVLP